MSDPMQNLVEELCSRFHRLYLSRRKHPTPLDEGMIARGVVREFLQEAVYCEDEDSEWLLIGTREKSRKVKVREVLDILETMPGTVTKVDRLEVAKRIRAHGIEVE